MFVRCQKTGIEKRKLLVVRDPREDDRAPGPLQSSMPEERDLPSGNRVTGCRTYVLSLHSSSINSLEGVTDTTLEEETVG